MNKVKKKIFSLSNFKTETVPIIYRKKMRIAIIGAGVAGLASARRCLENDFADIVVYERSKVVGGTWVYDERIGLDEFGLPIHTSMYQNLMFV